MRSPVLNTLVIASFAGLVAYGVAHSSSTSAAANKETVYERVMRTGTLRCGYIVSPPYLLKDPNTGKMSGTAYDITEAVAKELNLKVQWAEETSWGNFQEGLNGNRYDLQCTPLWQSGLRARAALLTEPVYYNGVYAFARADDDRFPTIESLNKPGIRLAIYEGDITQDIRKKIFPLSQEYAIPQMSDAAQGMISVATGKADVDLDNPVNARTFNTTAERKLKLVAGGQPLRVFGNVFAVKMGEYDFKLALDATIEALHNSGELSAIITKYAPDILDGAPNYIQTKTVSTR